MKPHVLALGLLLLSPPLLAQGRNDPTRNGGPNYTCDELAELANTGKGSPGVHDSRRQLRNVVVFDHEKGTVVWPAPARLRVPDRGHFVVVFANTDPTRFNYSINLLGEEAAGADVDLTAGGPGVPPEQQNHVCVTWRHLESFPLYRVKMEGRVVATPGAQAKVDAALAEAGRSAGEGNERKIESARARAAAGEFGEILKELPEEVITPDLRSAIAEAQNNLLYPYTFPVWVETAGAKLTYSTGFGFSDLADERFFVMEGADDAKTVERDRDAEDDFRPELMAYATLSWPRLRNFGITGGVGLSGNDGDPRYFFGPSWLIGRRLVLGAGAFGAKVARLPKGQRLGEAPINDQIEARLEVPDERFEVGFGVTLSWRLGGGEAEFLTGIGARQANLAQ
jgi:hypothetical protein